MDRDGASAWGLNGLSVMLALICMILPSPIILIICALMPWAALLALWRSRGRMVVSVDRREKRPNIVLAIAAPAAGLAIKGASICDFMDWRPAFAVAAVVSILLFFAVTVMQRGKLNEKVSLAVLLLLTGGGYGVGVFALIDALGDKTIVATYRPQILAKTPRQGRNDDVLVLSPWAGRKGGNEPVSYDLFNTVKVGGQVCIDVHPGRLKLEWYEVHVCPQAPRSPGA